MSKLIQTIALNNKVVLDANLNQISKEKIDLKAEVNLIRKKIKDIGSYSDVNNYLDIFFQSFLANPDTFEIGLVNEVCLTYFSTIKPLIESIFNSDAHDTFEKANGYFFEIDDMTLRNLEIMWESYFLSVYVDASPGEDRENNLSLYKTLKDFFRVVLVKKSESPKLIDSLLQGAKQNQEIINSLLAERTMLSNKKEGLK